MNANRMNAIRRRKMNANRRSAAINIFKKHTKANNVPISKIAKQLQLKNFVRNLKLSNITIPKEHAKILNSLSYNDIKANGKIVKYPFSINLKTGTVSVTQDPRNRNIVIKRSNGKFKYNNNRSLNNMYVRRHYKIINNSEKQKLNNIKHNILNGENLEKRWKKKNILQYLSTVTNTIRKNNKNGKYYYPDNHYFEGTRKPLNDNKWSTIYNTVQHFVNTTNSHGNPLKTTKYRIIKTPMRDKWNWWN